MMAFEADLCTEVVAHHIDMRLHVPKHLQSFNYAPIQFA